MSENDFVFDTDFTEAVERVLLPIDWYRVRVETLTRKESQGGDPMISVLLRVVDGPYAEQPLFTNWMQRGKGAGITKGAIRAFLGDSAVDVAGKKTQFRASELIGAVADVRVTQKIWAEEQGGDGELQNRLSRWRPVEHSLGPEGEVADLFSK